MFGYVRPLRGKLRVEEYEQYRAVYCGLCRTLGRRCGFSARFTVNYDFTFLAMVLSAEPSVRGCCRRCPAHPFRPRLCMESDRALELAADFSVILTWWKLRDTVADERLLRRLAARLGCLFLRQGYREAEERQPFFSTLVQEKLAALTALETAPDTTPDAAADAFAEILAGASLSFFGERSRILRQLLYHTGRVIYLLDAIDDLPEDMAAHRFNPLIRRFGLTAPTLDDSQKEALRCTLSHSLGSMGGSLQLLTPGPYTDILHNIVYLGIPAVCGAVLAGNWHKGRNHTESEKIYERSV